MNRFLGVGVASHEESKPKPCDRQFKPIKLLYQTSSFLSNLTLIKTNSITIHTLGSKHIQITNTMQHIMNSINKYFTLKFM